MLSVIYAEYHNYALYAHCRYAECHYAECRGAKNKIEWKWLIATYTLAYSDTELITAVKILLVTVNQMTNQAWKTKWQ